MSAAAHRERLCLPSSGLEGFRVSHQTGGEVEVSDNGKPGGDVAIPMWRELPMWARFTIVVLWLQAFAACDAAYKFERLCSQYFPAGVCR